MILCLVTVIYVTGKHIQSKSDWTEGFSHDVVRPVFWLGLFQ